MDIASKDKCACIVPGEEKPVISPRPSWRANTNKAIIVFSPRIYNMVASSSRRISERHICDGSLYKCAIIKYGATRILLSLPYWGAPAAVVGLERLIAAGIQEIIVLGLAGSITPKASTGDILVPTWGIREEGASYHYMPPNYIPKPHRLLLTRFLKILKETKGRKRHRILIGGVWSTDAFYRETLDKILKYSKQGVIGVDMEMTALFTVAYYRKARIVGALAISDELYTGEWKPGFESKRLKRAEKIIAIAALRTLSEKSS